MRDDCVMWYSRGTAVVGVYFPEDKVCCRYCRFLRSDAGGARYKCGLTDEILVKIEWRGQECPVNDIVEEKEDDK